MIQPPHPGETLKKDCLIPLDRSVNALAKALGIGPSRLNEIVRGKRGVTADPPFVNALLQPVPRILAEFADTLRTAPRATEGRTPYRTQGSTASGRMT